MPNTEHQSEQGNTFQHNQPLPDNPYTQGQGGYAGASDFVTVPPLWMPWYGIGFGGAVRRFWRKAFIFHGRASRSEYWWACLFQILAMTAVAAIAMGLDGTIGVTSADDGPFYSMLTLVMGLVLFIPNCAVGIRRLHDENLRGWWILMPLLLFALSLAAAAVAISAGNGSSQSVVIGLLCFLALYVLSDIASVVLMVLPSKPAGMRFDKQPHNGTGYGDFHHDQPRPER